ncbi:MAG: DNA topoisomerase 3 [Paludibacteraceae bacterium]|nr:DNA topoisomerase 3 [Paludibacteraceae bacterium]
MILCVAEKPSAGRDIAKVLGANTRHDGYLEGNGYCVTWTFGHLCALYDPHEYNEQWKGWNMSALPMIPERFSIKVSGDEGVQKQFNVIKQLISQATEVINCGDPGQEGELIQRWVYQQAGCKVPVKRLWTSSLTEEAIRDAFKQLKDQSAYQHLYEAGLMRAIGDWLLGMNASRAYTLKYARGVGKDRNILSIGRVQTPTLALIVKRQQEIERFVPRTYYELKTLYRDTLFSYIFGKQESLDNPESPDTPDNDDLKGFATLEEAQAVIDAIKDQPLTITSVEKKKGTEFAPRLFDLTSLQVECNKSYGYTAEHTLKLIQSLYEKHVTTYPRVDTTYLSEDIYAHVPKTLDGIKDFFPEVQPLLGLKADGKKGEGSLPKSKKVFDNKKVTDHHAIIPTGQRPDSLTDQEKKVFRKIALRFIAAFYPDCQVSNTTVFAKIGEYDFKVTGRQVLVPGWRAVFAKPQGTQETPDNPDSPDTPDSQDNTATQTLPDFVKGEQGSHNPQLKEKTTTPPKYYTEATLLRAMETAGKTVEDEDLRDAMKENGIGRPSTRAAIIEKLFQRKYIERQGKTVHATPLGIDLIAKIISPLLMSAELTGRWEKKMRMIERGEYEARDFLAELKQMTTEVVREVKADQAGAPCPLCKQGRIIRGRTRYGCSRWREGCTYAAPFTL